jgi:hypothetical protein
LVAIAGASRGTYFVTGNLFKYIVYLLHWVFMVSVTNFH